MPQSTNASHAQTKGPNFFRYILTQLGGTNNYVHEHEPASSIPIFWFQFPHTHTMAVVGVLALQGSFNEHIAGMFTFFISLLFFPHSLTPNLFLVTFVLCVAALRRLGVKGVEIRKPEQLLTVNSLIIPGGESTSMAKLAEYFNLVGFFFLF